MTFQISDEAYTGKVVIKVNDLLGMVNFYQNKIGLDVLESTETGAVLGIRKDDRELLELVKINKPNLREVKTGLYHMAFKVPTREDLGNSLYSLIALNQLEVQGASDHGYSEALYLADPEDNGIEIYWDKPKEEWDIQEDGTIKGITIPMDVNGVLDARSKTPYDRLPEGTVMGHVHLMATNLETSEEFYSDVLGLGLKYRFGPAALFYAAGEYHHHVGLNVWQSREADQADEKDLGLDYYTIHVPDEEELTRVKNNVTDYDYEVFEETESSFKVTDINGVTVKLAI